MTTGGAMTSGFDNPDEGEAIIHAARIGASVALSMQAHRGRAVDMTHGLKSLMVQCECGWTVPAQEYGDHLQQAAHPDAPTARCAACRDPWPCAEFRRAVSRAPRHRPGPQEEP